MGVTVTWQMDMVLSTYAIISVSPSATAVITPDEDTVAILVLLLIQFNVVVVALLGTRVVFN